MLLFFLNKAYDTIRQHLLLFNTLLSVDLENTTHCDVVFVREKIEKRGKSVLTSCAGERATFPLCVLSMLDRECVLWYTHGTQILKTCWLTNWPPNNARPKPTLSLAPSRFLKHSLSHTHTHTFYHLANKKKDRSGNAKWPRAKVKILPVLKNTDLAIIVFVVELNILS